MMSPIANLANSLKGRNRLPRTKRAGAAAGSHAPIVALFLHTFVTRVNAGTAFMCFDPCIPCDKTCDNPLDAIFDCLDAGPSNNLIKPLGGAVDKTEAADDDSSDCGDYHYHLSAAKGPVLNAVELEKSSVTVVEEQMTDSFPARMNIDSSLYDDPSDATSESNSSTKLPSPQNEYIDDSRQNEYIDDAVAEEHCANDADEKIADEEDDKTQIDAEKPIDESGTSANLQTTIEDHEEEATHFEQEERKEEEEKHHEAADSNDEPRCEVTEKDDSDSSCEAEIEEPAHHFVFEDDLSLQPYSYTSYDMYADSHSSMMSSLPISSYGFLQDRSSMMSGERHWSQTPYSYYASPPLPNSSSTYQYSHQTTSTITKPTPANQHQQSQQTASDAPVSTNDQNISNLDSHIDSNLHCSPTNVLIAKRTYLKDMLKALGNKFRKSSFPKINLDSLLTLHPSTKKDPMKSVLTCSSWDSDDEEDIELPFQKWANNFHRESLVVLGGDASSEAIETIETIETVIGQDNSKMLSNYRKANAQRYDHETGKFTEHASGREMAGLRHSDGRVVGAVVLDAENDDFPLYVPSGRDAKNFGQHFDALYAQDVETLKLMEKLCPKILVHFARYGKPIVVNDTGYVSNVKNGVKAKANAAPYAEPKEGSIQSCTQGIQSCDKLSGQTSSQTSSQTTFTTYKYCNIVSTEEEQRFLEVGVYAAKKDIAGALELRHPIVTLPPPSAGSLLNDVFVNCELWGTGVVTNVRGKDASKKLNAGGGKELNAGTKHFVDLIKSQKYATKIVVPVPEVMQFFCTDEDIRNALKEFVNGGRSGSQGRKIVVGDGAEKKRSVVEDGYQRKDLLNLNHFWVARHGEWVAGEEDVAKWVEIFGKGNVEVLSTM